MREFSQSIQFQLGQSSALADLKLGQNNLVTFDKDIISKFSNVCE